MAAQCKTLEIRDEGTHIPALAIKLDPGTDRDHYCFARAGFGTEPLSQGRFVLLIKLATMEAKHDPHAWRDSRTMGSAHEYILHNWDDLESGQVLDVRHILGESPKPAISDQFA